MNRLNILFISATVPYPAIDGGRIRVLNLVLNLNKVHNVTFVCFRSNPSDDIGIEYLRNVGIEVIAVVPNRRALSFVISLLKKPITVAKYYSSNMSREIGSLIESRNFDVIHFEMLHTGQYIRELPRRVVSLLDQQNVDSVIWRRLAETEQCLVKRAMFYWQYKSFRRFERDLCKEFNKCLCVSSEDATALKTICPSASVEVIPNGVDPEYYKPLDVAEDDNHLVFTGSMDWQPNEDAVVYFCERILPLIKSEFPKVKFYIVGSNPTARVKRLGNIDGVVVTGLVDDVRPYIASASVYVVPLRIGGGTRLKILQALSMKKAVVTTSIGCEGLKVRKDLDLLIADDPDLFAKEVMRCMKDSNLRRTLGENGRRIVLNDYDWKVIASQLNHVLNEAITST